jgi:hypothetical protein
MPMVVENLICMQVAYQYPTVKETVSRDFRPLVFMVNLIFLNSPEYLSCSMP